MAIEDFANCYANRVGTTVDAVIADLQSIGAQGVRSVVDWWNSLDANSRQLVTVLATFATTTLGVILTKALNATLAAALIAFLGGASWTLLVLAFNECSNLL